MHSDTGKNIEYRQKLPKRAKSAKIARILSIVSGKTNTDFIKGLQNNLQILLMNRENIKIFVKTVNIVKESL